MFKKLFGLIFIFMAGVAFGQMSFFHSTVQPAPADNDADFQSKVKDLSNQNQSQMNAQIQSQVAGQPSMGFSPAPNSPPPPKKDTTTTTNNTNSNNNAVNPTATTNPAPLPSQQENPNNSPSYPVVPKSNPETNYSTLPPNNNAPDVKSRSPGYTGFVAPPATTPNNNVSQPPNKSQQGSFSIQY